MADVKITVRENGPLLVEGPFTLCDATGAPFPIDPAKPAYALCRCGQSKNAPFCDGTHKTSGFVSAPVAPKA